MSAKNDDLDSVNAYSEDRNRRIPGASNTAGEAGFLNIPGHNPNGAEDSGLITSDSDFDKAAEKAGYNESLNGPK